MENYEDEIRPALARFCGWSWDDKRIYDSANEMRYQRMSGNQCQLSRILPDPLHNPADAWALQRVLLDKGAKVELYRHMGMFACDMFPLNRNMIHTREDTPEAALVLAAYAVVKENSDPKKHLPGSLGCKCGTTEAGLTNEKTLWGSRKR